jgi:hypothetical protein
MHRSPIQHTRQTQARRISQRGLALGIVKLFIGLMMLRIPDLAGLSELAGWPLIASGVLLVAAGAQCINQAIVDGGDVNLMLVTHRLTGMRLANPVWQWASLSIVITMMTTSVFTLLYANAFRTAGEAAFLLSLLTLVLTLLGRITVRLPMYFTPSD